MHIAQWRVIDQLRKRRAGVLEPLPPDADATDQLVSLNGSERSDLEVLWDQEWERNLIDAAMDRVKRKVKADHYQIFDLLVAREWSVPEVASLHKISRAQVYLIKHRVAGLVKKEIQALRTKPI